MSEITSFVELATAVVTLAAAVVGLIIQACAQRPRRKKKNRWR